MPLLHWLTRGDDIHSATHAPYRLLEEVSKHSHGEHAAENMLIHGDNLDALKALLPYYAGRVKCIFIDPPYNTRSAFEHYDDNLEHTQWLAMMYPRLELLRQLLAEDGSIWVTIDDNEGHYLKVIMDAVFGRKNFVATITWQKRVSPANDAKYFSSDHDYVIVYAKRKEGWSPNKLVRTEQQNSYYKNPDNGKSFDLRSYLQDSVKPSRYLDRLSNLIRLARPCPPKRRARHAGPRLQRAFKIDACPICRHAAIRPTLIAHVDRLTARLATL